MSLPFSLSSSPCTQAIFVLITFAFTFAGHWLYGSRVFEFRTWNVAFGYLLRTLTEGIEYETLKNASPGATPLYVTAWIGIVTLVLLNMFIAILTDSYAFVQVRDTHTHTYTHTERERERIEGRTAPHRTQADRHARDIHKAQSVKVLLKI